MHYIFTEHIITYNTIITENLTDGGVVEEADKEDENKEVGVTVDLSSE